MKRGRKPAKKLEKIDPRRKHDRIFLEECENYIKQGIDPDPPFVRELLRRYVEMAPVKQFSRPEIAAMVDVKAINCGSIAEAIRHVHSQFNGKLSLEAIKQAHTKFGEKAPIIKAERDRRDAASDQIMEDFFQKLSQRNNSEELREVFSDIATALQEQREIHDKEYAEYQRLKKELFD